MAYEPVPDGDLAAVVTFLEMRKAPAFQIPASNLSLRRIEHPEVDSYRQLFRRIGRHWLWFSRLILSDEELAAIIDDPAVELYIIVDEIGADIGMIELDFREPGQCELAFIGILPELTGMGHGRWLTGQTLRLAWRDGVRRLHVDGGVRHRLPQGDSAGVHHEHEQGVAAGYAEGGEAVAGNVRRTCGRAGPGVVLPGPVSQVCGL